MVFIRDVIKAIRIVTGSRPPHGHAISTTLLFLTCMLGNFGALAGGLDRSVLFNIQAESLDRALLDLGAQAHVQISIESTPAVRSLQTEKLVGEYTIQNGLAILLRGSKLAFIRHGNTIVIVPSPSETSKTERHEESDSKKKQSAPRSQATDPTTTPDTQKKKPAIRYNVAALQGVVVTGTHIRGVAPAYPVTTMSRADILQSGLPSVGDALRTSPLVFSGGMNSGALQVGPSIFNTGDQETGVSTANLLGIGPDATLTLVDGRRLAGTGDLPSGDLSLIPLVAVQNVEIQTGGSSAIYGSDAVAGVVNVILRKDYNGAETSGYVGWTPAGGDFTQRYSQLLGRTSSRGSVMVAAEFDKTDPLTADQRAISRAVGPNEYLEPRQKSVSLLLNTDYAVSEQLTAHATGLYTHRTAFSSTVQETFPSRSDEFDSDVGMTYHFSPDRSVGVDLIDGGYNQVRYITQLPSLAQQVEAIQNGLFGVDLHGSGTMVDLPTGPLSMAAGTAFRRENINVEGNIGSSAIGSRRVTDAYLETSVPLVRESTSRPGVEALRLDAAGQYSDYSDFGATRNGMVGIVYTPFRPVMLKATYETSFRTPTLDELYKPFEVAVYPGRVFQKAPAGSEVLYELGANSHLGPERAHSFTGTLQLSPQLKRIPGDIRAAATYYYIRFTDRIGNPILNPAQALINPIVQPFVISNPTITQQNAAIAAANGELVHVLGAPYIPTSVTALIENDLQNISVDVIHGAVANADYKLSTRFGDISATWSGAWLNFDQRIFTNSAPEQISGTLFNPPNFKMRASLAWSRSSWTAVGFINRTSSEQFFPGAAQAPIRIGAWTTIDSQLGYVIRSYHAAAAATLAVSGTNLANKRPPGVPAAAFYSGQNVGFDTYNTSAVGRMFAVSLIVDW